MKLVDWGKVLKNSEINVTFSSLQLNEKRGESSRYRDVAEIVLPGNFVIDIEWWKGEYAVTLHRKNFDSPIRQAECDDVDQVIDCVRQFSVIGHELLVEDSDDSETETMLFTTSEELDHDHLGTYCAQ